MTMRQDIIEHLRKVKRIDSLTFADNNGLSRASVRTMLHDMEYHKVLRIVAYERIGRGGRTTPVYELREPGDTRRSLRRSSKPIPDPKPKPVEVKPSSNTVNAYDTFILKRTA